MAKLKISAKSQITNVTYPNPQNDRFVNPDLFNGVHEGGTGGLTSLPTQVINPTVYINKVGAVQSSGSIIAQKGAHKFEVTDGTYTGKCTLVNATTLSAGQMNLWANICIIPSATMASSNVAGGATSATVTWTAGTTIGPVATPRVGDYLSGFTSGNIGSFGAQVTAVNSSTSVTVSVAGNIAAQTVLANTLTYVSRIDNKYIHDFITDGQINSTSGQSGNTTYYTSGYNPTKFRYLLTGNATSQFARVQAA